MANAVDLEKLVDLYVKLRDKKKEMDDQAKEAVRPITEGMEKIEAVLMGKLAEANVQSMNTAAGTFFKAKKESVTVANREGFYKWARENGQEDLLDIRAAKTNIIAYMESPVEGAVPDTNGEILKKGLPPGLNYSAFTEVQVRRK